MAQEQKRDGTVRLPNPSAQAFVQALKTARFFAVLFFWVTMVCVLGHAATFFMVEWVGVYEARDELPAVAPVADPAAAPPAPAPAAAVPAAPGAWLGVFENAAHAAAPGELFPNVKPEGKAAPKTPVAPDAAEKSAETADEPLPVPPAEGDVTRGTVVAQPEEPAPRKAPLTGEQRRMNARYYYNLTACLLRPARIVGVLSSLLLAVTLFLYLQIALLGRLSGIRQLTKALFLLLIFLATVLPWSNVFDGFEVTALANFDQVLAAHEAHAGGGGDWAVDLSYYGRYLVLPLVSVILLTWSGIQFAAGYAETVLANE
jgi:hypothetical protein